MFLLSITIFLFLDTFFDTLSISFWVTGGVIVVCIFGMIFSYFSSPSSSSLRWSFLKIRKKCRKQIFTIFVAFVLTSLAILRKNYQYIQSQGNVSKSYIGTGIIAERRGNGSYVFVDKNGRKYLYYAAIDYPLGALLYTTASVEKGTGATIMTNMTQSLKRESIIQKSQQFMADERGFNKAKRLLMKGWAGVIYEKNAETLGQQPGNIFSQMRGKLASLLSENYSRRTGGLTLGMLVGDRSYLSKEEYQSFVDSGLVHIVAVSGGNIVLIISFMSFLLFFLPYYVRLTVIASAVVLYALLCGMDSSVIRATLMAIMSLVALFAGRTLSVWRSMKYVYISMLLWNPYYLLYDLGFVFSFSALLGLVFFANRRSLQVTKKISARSLIVRFWSIYLLPSMAASLGIASPLLFFTNRINILSILSNIAVIPLVPFVMIYGFFAVVLYSITSWQRLLRPQERIIKRIYLVNEWSNAHAIQLLSTTGSVRIIVLIVILISISTYIIYKRMV